MKSPKEEKKEHDLVAPAPPAKEPEATPEASKPLEEAQVAAPATPVAPEAAAESTAPKTEESKPVAASGTPSKEKEHFSFGKLFGSSKDRAKSPSAQEKAPEAKVDAAPKIEDTPAAAPATTEAVKPVEPVVPATEAKVEPSEEQTPPKAKRTSIFGQLSRSLSKATGGKKDTKEKKDTTPPATVPETTEEAKTDAPVVADKPTETPAAAAPAEKTIGDVPAEAVTVGEPKSTPAVSTTA